MKARLSFKYNVHVGEDFDYIEKRYFKIYDRSAILTVTADTEKECNDLLENFKEYIADNSNYGCWDSSQDAELNKKNGKWVGDVEILIEEKSEFEEYKDLYKEWKELVRNPAPAPVETAPVAEETWSEVKLEKSSVVQNDNGKKYRVLAQHGDYTVLQCQTPNVIGICEIVVAWVVKQSSATKKISWLQGSYFSDSSSASEYFLKKTGLSRDSLARRVVLMFKLNNEGWNVRNEKLKKKVAELVDTLADNIGIDSITVETVLDILEDYKSEYIWR